MSESYGDPPRAEERQAWLLAERARYLDAPCLAVDLLAPTQRIFEQALTEGPSDFAVELGLHLAELLGEAWRSEGIEAVLDQVLPWTERGFGAAVRPAMTALRCRMHLRFGRLPAALALLEDLTRLCRISPRVVDQAHRARVLGQALAAQQEYRRAIDCMSEALRLYKQGGDRSRWVDLYVSLSFAHRALGDPEAQLRALQEGVREAASQLRWIAACNALSGVAELHIASGQPALAEAALAEGRDYLLRAGRGGERIEKELWAAEAASLAARQDFAGAVALMQKVVAQSMDWSVRRQVVRRLRQLSPWLQQLGRVDEAMAALQQAHDLELQEVREAGRQDTAAQLQRLELEHARAEQARSEAHGRELAVKNVALAQALQLQRELQGELIEASKFATLGTLLAGLAHELNTPLGSALTASSTVADLSRGLETAIGEGAVSRSRLIAELRACKQAAELSSSSVARALALVASYKHLDSTDDPETPQELQLQLLIRATWDRTISPGSPLRLEVDTRLLLRLRARALSEVLAQLFQNAERHAYAPGVAGVVRVQARVDTGRVLLSLSDEGCGIAPELLPRIFDPYVSTQFGRGRSGLGLFVAQAAVSQRLQGRIRAHSEPGAGCRFELEWPLEVQ
ncbi:MAG: sensor histidine kinase [Burkholderiaceae bacterium]|nr:sensor histidine kinase [Burkholderiaceae bacterium]